MNLTEWHYVIGMPAENPELVTAINAALDREFGSKRDSQKYSELVRKYMAGPTLDTSSLPAGTRVYVVKPGESIRSIAQAQMGNENLANDLWNLNKARFGNRLLIHPGDKLVLP